ncbi:MAG: type II secretion system protein [Candidatus Paceibacterota bacterium]
MYKLKAKSYKLNRGMTYVELIVVLSIFSVLTSVVLFNYGDFQAKVDIKILANDIASKIIEVQKAALSGELPTVDQQNILAANNQWKPSYGLYFNSSSTDLDTSISPAVTFNKEIIYFTSFDNINNYYNKLSSDSILDHIRITKNNSITKLEAFGCGEVDDLSIVFKRPDSSAFISDSSGYSFCSSFEYARITVSSSGSNPFTAHIRVYPSGRVQIE